ncbi:MAG: glycosyltransferase family 9 protein, partial [Chloroflexi bacterium]|nr:glycosyltransferase family 9 protein [Chloroflexota bacterium]
EAETYLDVGRAMGILVSEPRLEFYPSPDNEQNVAEYFSSLGNMSRKLVAIHPAGGKNPGMELASKRWPAERFAAVGDLLQREAATQVVLIGGPGDEEIAQAVARNMKKKALDLTGQLNWGETGALLKKCALFIGNDTGAMHLATAVGTPTVAIFGPSDPRIYGPLGEKSIALWHGPEEGLPPLYRVAGEERYQGLIEKVTVEEVWEAARNLLRI